MACAGIRQLQTSQELRDLFHHMKYNDWTNISTGCNKLRTARTWLPEIIKKWQIVGIICKFCVFWLKIMCIVNRCKIHEITSFLSANIQMINLSCLLASTFSVDSLYSTLLDHRLFITSKVGQKVITQWCGLSCR